MICTTRPRFCVRPSGTVVRVSVAAAVAMKSLSNPVSLCELCVSGALALQRRRAADDLRDLLCDRRLALAVVGPGERLRELPRVVGRILHRGAPRAVLRGRRLD